MSSTEYTSSKFLCVLLFHIGNNHKPFYETDIIRNTLLKSHKIRVIPGNNHKPFYETDIIRNTLLKSHKIRVIPGNNHKPFYETDIIRNTALYLIQINNQN
jgi:hypothetical protein